MARMIVDARQPFDDAGDARQIPEIRVKTVSSRALAQSPLDPLALDQTQFRLTASPAGTAQGRGPASLPLFVPPTDTLATHLEVSSNGG